MVSLKDSKLINGPSYSDDWLLGFHNKAQDEKQLVTNSLSLWNEEQQREQQNILDWQESFQRNGYADFTPPMSAGLNCLMVGGDIDTSYQQQQRQSGETNQPSPREGRVLRADKLPWEEQAEAAITSMRVVPSVEKERKGGDLANSHAPSLDTVLVSMPSGADVGNDPAASTKLRVGVKKAAVYD